MPPRARPDTSPDPDGGFDLAQGFQVLIDSIDALGVQMSQQTAMTARQMDAQARFGMTGAGRAAGADHAEGLMQASLRPQMQRDVTRSLSAQNALHPDLTAGLTRMSGMGALTSLKNMQAYGAQRFGEWVADRTRGTRRSV